MNGGDGIAFHVVTGFLGAGKTTLINRLLRAEELADALVIVNEWGEIGLDHLLYERLTGDAVLINSGCVCCALRGDLVETLRDVLLRRESGALPRFRRIVLETTGLAEPAPILHALLADPALASRLALAGVTAVVDAVNGMATLCARAESARQIALADRLVIAKSDLLPQAERASRLAALEAALRGLNPSAPIVDGAAADFGPAEFMAAPLSSPARSAGEGDHAQRGGGAGALRMPSRASSSAPPNPSTRALSPNSCRRSARCSGRGSCASRACSRSPTGRRRRSWSTASSTFSTRRARFARGRTRIVRAAP